jgi:predicted RNase H-like nuclease (RuvC/YqgF family)
VENFTYEKLVELTNLDFKIRQPILRTPEIAPYWEKELTEMYAESNSIIGNLNQEVKTAFFNESVMAQLNDSLAKAINHRSRLRAKLYEARNLLGIDERQESSIKSVKKLQAELNTVKKLLSDAKEKITRLETDNKRLLKELKSEGKYDPDSLLTRLKVQMIHARRMELGRLYLRDKIFILQDLIKQEKIQKEEINKILEDCMHSSKMTDYIEPKLNEWISIHLPEILEA